MKAALRSLLLVVVAVSFGLGAFFMVSSAIHVVDADQLGKARARLRPEPLRNLTPQERVARFKPGKAWDGVGRGGIGQAGIESFTEYPLLWLGERFGDFNLQTVKHIKYTAPAGARSADRVTFIYGECVPAHGAEKCAVPAQVQVQPVCAILPAWIEEEAKSGPLQNLNGGAKLQKFADGHVLIWTGEIVVEITVVADPAMINRAIAELRGAGKNDRAHGHNLSAPDFSACP